MNTVILDLLTKYLGPGTKKKDQNYAFFCPFCNHPKQKLEVDINLTITNKGNWKCWVCNTKNRNIRVLFTKLNASKSDLALLPTYGESRVEFSAFSNRDVKQEVIQLPIGYKPLTGTETELEAKYTLSKLYSRGLSIYDILKYKIGYIESGVNSNYVVIPSYDEYGSLNYYILKNFKTNSYLNPPLSKDKVIFEFFINWNEDLILVEGVFDAFAVQRNVTPLLGKTMSNTLKSKISCMTGQNIYICLDGGESKAMNEIADFVTKVGKNAYIVNLPPGEDPSSIGKHNVDRYIKSAVKVDTSNIFFNTVLNKLR